MGRPRLETHNTGASLRICYRVAIIRGFLAALAMSGDRLNRQPMSLSHKQKPVPENWLRVITFLIKDIPATHDRVDAFENGWDIVGRHIYRIVENIFTASAPAATAVLKCLLQALTITRGCAEAGNGEVSSRPVFGCNIFVPQMLLCRLLSAPKSLKLRGVIHPYYSAVRFEPLVVVGEVSRPNVCSEAVCLSVCL